jgi:hypothetical protein
LCSADLINKSFTYQSLTSGDVPKWELGDGTIDSAGSVGLANVSSSGGSHFTNRQDVASLSINPSDVVIDSLDPDFKGFLTPDKKVLIVTNTDGQPGFTNYNVMILTISGQTFATSDLAGVWKTHSLSSGSTAQWIHSTATIDATGAGSLGREFAASYSRSRETFDISSEYATGRASTRI